MGEEEKEKIKILHVGNISLTATKDHVYTMFNYIGKITEFKIYPSESNLAPNINSRSAFIKYEDERCVEVGQHLTNVVLIDQAIVCIPYLQQTIPDEESYYKSGGIATAGQRQLPPHVLNKTADIGDGSTVLLTVDPTLEQLGLPQYPTLPGDTDLAKAEEIRRTVYVGNLPKGVKGEAILEFFNMYVGEVMYLRMATGPETLPCAYAYIEFSQQSSVPIALQNNGIEFEGKPLRIQHSRVAIIKPLQKTDDQALEEIEEAIRQGKSGDDRDRRRSRSPIRRRRSPSPRRRSPVSSPRRDRRRSRSRDRKRSRSRDRDRERDRERERDRDRRKRSRSRDHRDRKRSRSRDRKRRSRSRDRKRNRSRDRSRSRDRKRDRKSSERKKDDKYSRKVEKSESIEELSLREKLLEKKAARRDERSSDSDWEEAGPKEKGDSSVRRNSDSE